MTSIKLGVCQSNVELTAAAIIRTHVNCAVVFFTYTSPDILASDMRRRIITEQNPSSSKNKKSTGGGGKFKELQTSIILSLPDAASPLITSIT